MDNLVIWSALLLFVAVPVLLLILRPFILWLTGANRRDELLERIAIQLEKPQPTTADMETFMHRFSLMVAYKTSERLKDNQQVKENGTP